MLLTSLLSFVASGLVTIFLVDKVILHFEGKINEVIEDMPTGSLRKKGIILKAVGVVLALLSLLLIPFLEAGILSSPGFAALGGALLALGFWGMFLSWGIWFIYQAKLRMEDRCDLDEEMDVPTFRDPWTEPE